MSDLKDLNFDSRDAYLAWKAQYKQEYFALARRIRKAKKHYKQPHRQFLRFDQVPDTTAYRGIRHDPVYSAGIDAYAALRDIQLLKAEARDMLELRRVSKLKAGEQWRAAHQERQATA